MSARHKARRGFAGHRPTPSTPANVVLDFNPSDAWNVGFDDPPLTDATIVLLQDLLPTPTTVASQTTAPGAGEADLIFVPVGGHSYAAKVCHVRNGEPGPVVTSNTVTP
jgi:hypothetical protein